jgi:hypothetical protein
MEDAAKQNGNPPKMVNLMKEARKSLPKASTEPAEAIKVVNYLKEAHYFQIGDQMK